ncbi:hypothetical protein V501_09118, partial [Pseudogymnoascus sp. VKM F-4519 (FW-2642)]
LISELIASNVQTQGKSSPCHAIHTFRKENSALHETIQDLYQKLIYTISQMDSLRADYNQLRIHNRGLNGEIPAIIWNASILTFYRQIESFGI